MAYFDRENAGQCGSCFNGTAAMSAVTEALRDGVATNEDLARLERWSVVLRGRGACATLDAATNVAASLLSAFPQVVERHLDNDCDSCRGGAFKAVRPYEIEAVADGYEDSSRPDHVRRLRRRAPNMRRSTSPLTTGDTRRSRATARFPSRTATR